ncbi:MAG: hypothetical protein RL660_726 [Bacteroidota bacterium]
MLKAKASYKSQKNRNIHAVQTLLLQRMKKHIGYFFLLLFCLNAQAQIDFAALAQDAYKGGKPITRWWWFASTIDKPSIADNLYWLKQHGFGGVEIAWVYPLNRMDKDTINYTPRQAWLSPQWTEMVAYAKKCADSLNLTCDFTFGSLWPFGDTKVPRKYATQKFGDKKWRQEITASWDYPKKGLVLDHLNVTAFDHYATRTGNALQAAMAGSTSALFCDSWEVETKYLTTPKFTKDFKARYHYDITSQLDSLYCIEPNVHRYRYMQLVADKVLNNFYQPFTNKAHSMFAYSRAQVSGAPVDVIEAYKRIDIPETEAMLYEPNFANIPASAAMLSNKKIVSCETFTCLYGWPREYIRKEQVADMKLVADAVFANGVNQIVWHGKPYTPAGTDKWRFYASVHLGDSSAFVNEVRPFNSYLTTVSNYMRKGSNYNEMALYLPLEDNWMKGELPIEEQFIWAWGYYELRNIYMPREIKKFRPFWVNAQSLKEARITDSGIYFGNNAAPCKGVCFYMEYIDAETQSIIEQLAKKGVPLYFRNNYSIIYNHTDIPMSYDVHRLRKKYKNVHTNWQDLDTVQGVVTGPSDIDFWIRQDGDTKYIFFAQPKARALKFPIEYGQAYTDSADVQVRIFTIKHCDSTQNITLNFKPYQSILLELHCDGTYKEIDINFVPSKPLVIERNKDERVKWKVYSDSKKH